ncbi:MAG: undecaprenyl-phosphate galactose phosphotransferase WbaP [Acidobacteriota bacterium]|nr:undecaprenyl-phosphate galactose phosphotransferase WbaP [Acidobacteriota bacterium]
MSVAIAIGWPQTAVSRPRLSACVIVAADLVALTASIMSTVLIRQFFNADYELSLYWRLWPVLGLFMVVYSMFGLYPGLVSSTVAELRKLSSATTLVFLVIGALSFLLRDANAYSRVVFLLGWIASLFLVPTVRSLIRNSLARASWWGYPVIVFGSGEMASKVVRKLLQNPEFGLRPAAVFDHHGFPTSSVDGVPVFRGFHGAASAATRLGISRAIIAAPSGQISELLQLIESHANIFSHVLIIPDLIGLSSVGIETRDICRMLGFELRRSLLLPGPRFAKRLIDLTLTPLIGLVSLPILALVALLIKIDSRGPVLYSQRRLGQRSGHFRVWKFRTMQPDGDRILREHLDKCPELLAEWKDTQKLKDDPRLTRVGRFLRKTSLDELPQLWNVIRGEMSLVGPRPIVKEEIPRYGDGYKLYDQVLPGLTGLWQVSGRNDTTYEERVELDTYYVRNWSPWIDIYLLARTIRVVLKGSGAY